VRVEGIDTTAELQRALVGHGDFRADAINTRWVEERFLPAWAAAERAPEARAAAS
jgi:acetyl-CoA carboxylase biotin carboxylase subunit